MYLQTITMRPVDVAARFAENLTRCRKEARMSQEELGIRASLHRTEISQLERGMRIARIDTLVKLASSLSIPPSVLIEGIAWEPGTATSGQFTDARSPRPEHPELN